MQKFPKDANLKRQWVKFVQVKRAHFVEPSVHSVICSNHFSPDCYENSYMAEIGLTKKKQLPETKWFEECEEPEVSFAEISTKISAVRWFNKTEDCIFPRSFIYGPMYNLSIFHNFSISQSALHLQYCSYLSTLSGSTNPFCVYPRFPKGLSCTLTSPLYLF